MSETKKYTDTIKFRAPESLRPRLKAIASFKGTKYQHEARLGITRFVESEEAVIKETKKAKKTT